MKTKAELTNQLQHMMIEFKELQDKIAAMPDDVEFGRSALLDDEIVKVWWVSRVGVFVENSYFWRKIKDTEGLNIWFWTKEEAENWLEKQKLLRDIREFVGHDPEFGQGCSAGHIPFLVWYRVPGKIFLERLAIGTVFKRVNNQLWSFCQSFSPHNILQSSTCCW